MASRKAKPVVPVVEAEVPGGEKVDEVESAESAESTDTAEAPAEVVVEDPNSPLDPEKFVAIDTGGGGTYEIHPIPDGYRPFARTLYLHNRTYEHVAEHRGVWAYRHLG